jgi:hypothetical protein
MEFPGDINVFDAVDFETAVPRSTGHTNVELLVQARPTVRIADRYRLAMGGSALLVLVQRRGHPQKHDHEQVDGLPHAHHQQHRGHHGPGRQRHRRRGAQAPPQQGATAAPRRHPPRRRHRAGPEDGSRDPGDAGIRSSAHQQACIRRVRKFYTYFSELCSMLAFTRSNT